MAKMKFMVAHKFAALVVTAMVGIALLTSLSMYSMARVYDAANYASINSLPSVLVLTDAFSAESSLSADIWNHLAQSDPARLAEIEKKMTDDRRGVDVALEKYEPLLSDDKDRALLAADRAAMVAYDGVKERVLELSRAGKKAEGRDLWVGNQSVSDEVVRRLDAHRKYNFELATHGSDEGVRVKSSALLHGILVACLTLLVVAAIGFAIARSIVRPLQQAVGVLSAIGQGRLDSQVIVTSSDETGQMLGALDAMQRNLKQRTDQERAVANENGRIKCALDRASASVMLTDENLNIIYSNEAAQQMFRANQADFKRDLPNFDAERIVGSSIDIFHKNPAHQRNMLARLQGTHTAEIRLGGHAMRIAASPVAGSDGKHTGIVVEWWDRTQEVHSEEEVSSIVKGALEGDLSKRISSQGKTGFYSVLAQSLNQLLENMAQIIERIQIASNEVLRGAEEISQGNADLSQRTEEQSASLEETASSMEQMTSTVKQNADNAGEANQLAVAARDQAQSGGTVVASAVRAMASINDASKKIADIIGVIDEIAFQTNLLALNAAVEAARAGEQGRGFAVVASEVRNLAGRSATAAKEIKELIQDSVRKVDDGSQLVTQSGQTLEHIITSVKKVSDIVAEIAAASREQSTGIEQVGRAVAQMDEATQQNAALVEQATAASRSVADQARELSGIIDKYHINGVGQPAGTAVTAGPREVSKANSSMPPPRAERRSAKRPWSGSEHKSPEVRHRQGEPNDELVAASSRTIVAW